MNRTFSFRVIINQIIGALVLGSILLIQLSSRANAQTSWTFNFGNEKSGSGIALKTTDIFSSDLGYGFGSVNNDHIQISKGYCTADAPFYFSVEVPEGTYEVELILGARDQASETTVKAESRRIMLFKEKVRKGKTIKKTITVNVRSTKINDNSSINLKERELYYFNWDKLLTLEFSGERPAIQSISIKPKQKYTTVFLAGNSTVTDQDYEPWASWGQMITRYFDADISVANYAESGATMSSFKARKRLDKVISLIQPGDYLFIEFGHNDQKQKGEGIGPWESFTAYIQEFVTKAREKGAYPVLITPTQRRSFNEQGEIILTHGEYPDATRKAAKDLDVPLIELHGMTKTMYEAWGPEPSRKAFVQYPANTFPGQDKKLEDNTHFNTFGANEVALCILQGIIENNLHLAKHIINFESYSPSQPNQFEDWTLIQSPRFESVKPDGN